MTENAKPAVSSTVENVVVPMQIIMQCHDLLMLIVNSRMERVPSPVYIPQIDRSHADRLCAEVQEIVEHNTRLSGD